MAKSKSSQGIDFVGFLLRFLLALGLVCATYNPTSYSYVGWFRDALSGDGLEAVHYLAGVLLLIGWVILMQATFASMGAFGLLLGAALIATLVWFGFDVGLLSGGGVAFYTWVVLVGLSFLLAVGLSWAHFWRRLTGQLSVDDVDDD